MIKSWIAKHWCLHRWREIKCSPCYDNLTLARCGGNLKRAIPIYRKYLYKCVKCGEFKEIKF